MAGFDVFALSSRAEGLPLALLEAMVRGIPPVCTSVGGVAGVIDDHKSGRLVPASSPESLSEALLEVLSDREGTARYAAAARGYVERRHSVQAMVDRYADLYEEVVLGTR
jgi:glycosyltransferase involved in cell wall biosynthesis